MLYTQRMNSAEYVIKIVVLMVVGMVSLKKKQKFGEGWEKKKKKTRLSNCLSNDALTFITRFPRAK